MIEKLGKYRIDGVLGTGAMGVVYKAFDPYIERTVAIKTIRKELFNDALHDELITRFKNEAQAAGRLNHPNIVIVYEYGEDSESAFIVMEFVDGTPLSTLMMIDEASDLARTTTLMYDLLTALEYAHSQGVIHRDIKPANLLITRAGRVKVSDFGIARVESSTLTQTGSMIGTPSYMSPEQFRGETVDRRSDVFSAGIVLYQLLTGARPFVGSTSVVMQQILNEMPVPPSRLNPSLSIAFDCIIEHALAKKPADRFTTARAFLNAFNAALVNSKVDPDATRLGDSDLTVLANEVQTVMAAAQLHGRSVKIRTLSSNSSTATNSASLTAWKLEALPTLDALLSRQIGPMAKILLTKVAAKAENIDDLRDMLLPHIPSDLGRVQFQEAVNELKRRLAFNGTEIQSRNGSVPKPNRVKNSIPANASGTALIHTHIIDEAFAEAAARQLMVFIGPIARVVAKRAMRQTQDKTEFLRLMAEQIPTLPERSRFIAETGSS